MKEDIYNLNVDFSLSFKGQTLQSSTGFAEGLSRQLVLNVILKPGERKSVKVKFTPVLNKTVSSVIIVRYGILSE